MTDAQPGEPSRADVLRGYVTACRIASVDPSGRYDTSAQPGGPLFSLSYDKRPGPSPFYNRGLADYEEEFDPYLRVKEFVGERLLDIGSGAYDRFGRAARRLGVRAVSVNPALQEAKHREFLRVTQQDEQADIRQAFYDLPLRRRFWRLRPPAVAPAPLYAVGAVGQNLPFRNSSFKAAVSLYAVPHYLHHVDPHLTDPEERRAAYTPEVRAADKALIGQALGEIVRVLEPGGRAFLKDRHAGPGEFGTNIYSPTDGSEVREVLYELQAAGVRIAVHEQKEGDGSGSVTQLPGVTRVIILEKP